MSKTAFNGQPINLAGTEIKEGDTAPEAVLVTTELKEIKVGGATGKKQLIVVVPSLDTPVCAMETRKFNEKAAAHGAADVTVVSMDLPFASGRFCSTEGINNLTVASDFRTKDFAKKYGVLIDEGPLAGVTGRAVFVVDENGKVIYREIVPEIGSEPDYDSALKALG